MRALVLLHRWLGVAVCALFALWFASGIVMHLVPFPSLTETERIAGLVPIDPSRVRHSAGGAASASGIAEIDRVRLMQRADGPVYIVAGASLLVSLRADDLSDARIASDDVARSIAAAYAQRRGLDANRITHVDVAMHDQWTVPNGYDLHRPLYRIALNDRDGTELYVSTATGEVVLDTTRFERVWNYAGSVVHWIYPTILRSNWAAWDRTVWSVSLIASIAALTGVLLGVLRLRKTRHGLRSPFRGWQAWHHILGLLCATFVVTWIVSGWLSMDHGRLFSRGLMSDTERAMLTPPLDMRRPSVDAMQISAASRQIEWFALGDRIYRRDLVTDDSQTITPIGSTQPPRSVLTTDDIAAAMSRVASGCKAPIIVRPDDPYPASSLLPSSPLYRAVCGDVWFHIDGANGVIVERLDPSRRAYRWAYAALHTFNAPFLINHPMLRSALIVGLCLAGFVFSLTGVVIGWRRLRRQFAS